MSSPRRLQMPPVLTRKIKPQDAECCSELTDSPRGKSHQDLGTNLALRDSIQRILFLYCDGTIRKRSSRYIYQHEFAPSFLFEWCCCSVSDSISKHYSCWIASITHTSHFYLFSFLVIHHDYPRRKAPGLGHHSDCWLRFPPLRLRPGCHVRSLDRHSFH